MTEVDTAVLQRAWSGVDGILVINLDSRPDRYARFTEQARPFFPGREIERISAVAGRELPSFGKEPWFTENTADRAGYWGGVAGCALSHRKAIAYAREKGWRNVLIFEDDVRFEMNRDSLEILGDMLPQLKGRYFCYLGYNDSPPFGWRCKRMGGASLWRTEGVITTHAYIVSSEMFDDLLAWLPREEDVWAWLSHYRAIDVFYRDFMPQRRGVSVYVVNPIICVQDDYYSDILMGDPDGSEKACRQSPRSWCSLAGVGHLLLMPYRRIKNFLNSIRTRRRGRRSGLPGYKRDRA